MSFEKKNCHTANSGPKFRTIISNHQHWKGIIKKIISSYPRGDETIEQRNFASRMSHSWTVVFSSISSEFVLRP